MELLHVYDGAGQELFVRDLAGETKPQLILVRDGRAAIAETASASDKVIGAFVRNEDGWSIASSSADVPVVSGPKSAPDMQLLPGMVCSVGGYAFRLERDSAATGCMLLWRVAGSNVVADAVVAGRNVVATGTAEGKPSVNPPLVVDELFEFFPAVDGLDVLTGVGEKRTRLQVPAGTLFSVGEFEGMYLAAADAEAAMKTSNPFSWPARGSRRALMGGLAALLGLFLVAAMINTWNGHLDRLLEGPRGAVESEPLSDHSDYVDNLDREAIYEIAFYRSLPDVLGPEPSPVAYDLIARGEVPEFTNNVEITRRVRFLKDVINIQTDINSGRWEMLSNTMARIDRKMFVLSDADRFYRDAQSVATYITSTMPDAVYEATRYDPDCTDVVERVQAWFASLESFQTNNIFLSGITLKREVARNAARRDAVVAYLKARRDAASEDQTEDYVAKDFIDLREAFCDMREQLSDSAYSQIVVREKEGIRKALPLAVAFIVRRAEADPQHGDAKLAVLEDLCELAETVEVDPERTAEWRALAVDAGRRLDRKFRSLYQTYRLSAASDPGKAREALDAMLDLGEVKSPFRTWALKEKEKLEK